MMPCHYERSAEGSVPLTFFFDSLRSLTVTQRADSLLFLFGGDCHASVRTGSQ